MADLNGSIVESSNDILREILVQLPPKSILRFTFVSRRWNDLIMDPCFIKRYDDCERRRKGSTSGRLLGFVQCNTMHLTTGEYIFQPWVSRHSFLSVSHEGHGGRFPRELGYFISSSNGLFLCGCHPTTYHVVNPMTKRWVSLPPPHKRFPYVSVGLACEERNHDFEARYKVLMVGIYNYYSRDTLPIETYSSVTGEWRESTLIAPYYCTISTYKPPTVIGGVFHWFDFGRSIVAVYDSSSEERVGRQEKHLQLIQFPCLPGSHALGRSTEGDLWCGSSNITMFTICMLPKAKQSSRSISYNEWITLHMVDMETLKMSLPITEDIALEKRIIARKARSKNSRAEMYKRRRYVYLVAFIPWDPRLVLIRLRESIFFYDLESETIDSVELHGYPSFTDRDWEWYPYFDSVSLSSYALGLKQQQQLLHIQTKMWDNNIIQ